MGILDHAKVTDKGIADAVQESLQMAFTIMLSTEITAAVIVLGEKKTIDWQPSNAWLGAKSSAIFLSSQG